MITRKFQLITTAFYFTNRDCVAIEVSYDQLLLWTFDQADGGGNDM